ncbi:MAG: hypothetical protein JNM07_10855 [Phycisphaerae bacterium]|nr:hypothetical protein [Phycisphaerae bacterium]
MRVRTKWNVALVVAAALLASGCTGHHHGGLPHHPPSPQGEQPDDALPASPFLSGIVLNARVPFETPHNALMQVRQGRRQYAVLFGPSPDLLGQPGPAPVGRGVLHNSAATWVDQCGYAYLSGIWPIGRGMRISAGARGTTLVLDVRPEVAGVKGIERIFLLHPTARESAVVFVLPEVRPPAGAPVQPWQIENTLTQEQYIETEDFVHQGQTYTVLSAPKNIGPATGPGGFDARAFIDAVLQKARDAGMENQQ